jgi:hypothetical protein
MGNRKLRTSNRQPTSDNRLSETEVGNSKIETQRPPIQVRRSKIVNPQSRIPIPEGADADLKTGATGSGEFNSPLSGIHPPLHIAAALCESRIRTPIIDRRYSRNGGETPPLQDKAANGAGDS